MKKWIYLLAIIGTVGAYTASQSASNEEVIKARKKLMKSNSKALKAIKKAAKTKDFAAIEVNATVLADNMKKLPSLFPKGSTAKDSRAKPAIWKKWDSFTGRADSMQTVAAFLAESAKDKNGELVAVMVKGIRCNDCHKPFRVPKKKKKKKS